ncbi:MAG: ABC transporter ATP-binding protein [Thermoanaerobaculia bacterium]
MSAAISLRSLSKRYGAVHALREVTLEVPEAEVFGFLGPNGAGKTTTIRLLLDLLRPTSGHAEVFGMDCRTRSRETRAAIGYLPGELALYGDMTGSELLDLLARLSGGRVSAVTRRHLLDRMALADADLKRKIREYSSGMRRKLGIVQAFQHEPPLLILDEPTEGLDPLMQEEFYGLVREVHAHGTTAFISSHVLAEVDRMCGRIALLREGEVILTGAVADVRALAPRSVRIHFLEDAIAPRVWPASLQVVEITPRLWHVRTRSELGELLALASAFTIRDLEIESPRLEDVIVGYYRRDQA